MKFCTDCRSLLKASTVNGILSFQCICGKSFPANEEDTLRYEQHFEVAESGQNFADLIDNAPFDLARNTVKKDCTECGNKVLTLVYIGTAEIPILVCECGQKYNVT